METAWINRYYEESEDILFKKGKVFVLFGPRRVGKTMLIEKLISKFKGSIYAGTGDNFDLLEILSSQSLKKIKSALGKYDLIFIDEYKKTA
jgi:predicted AAA+ superfamily ATPase